MKVAVLALAGWAFIPAAWSHGVPTGDAEYAQSVTGLHAVPFAYLGAKHMMTGYDHLLFLAGVVFFLHRIKDAVLYATLFAVGHSVTLLVGVIADVHANPFMVDAVIALSVIYKALENMGAFRHLPFRIDTRAAVLVFGLAHGFGLATALQALSLSEEGLFANLIAFNVGVELGQIAALTLILLALMIWRRSASFERMAYTSNVLILAAGMLLFGYQLTGLLLSV